MVRVVLLFVFLLKPERLAHVVSIVRVDESRCVSPRLLRVALFKSLREKWPRVSWGF